MYIQRQHKERAKPLNFAKATMANLCIRQCFPRQNPTPTDSPKFYLAKVLCYTIYSYRCLALATAVNYMKLRILAIGFSIIFSMQILLYILNPMLCDV